MNRQFRGLNILLAFLIGLPVLFSTAQPMPVLANSDSSLALQEGGDGERRGYSAETGKLTFLGADPSNPIALAGVSALGAGPETVASAAVEVYGPEFGLQNPSTELTVAKTSAIPARQQTVKYQQVYRGIPVLGGELNVNLTGEGYLLAMSGEIAPSLSLSTQPQISAEQAAAWALPVIARAHGLPEASLAATAPELWIYDERLLKPSDRPAALVWRMEVSADSAPVRELVLVDATNGRVVLHFNQIDTAWSSAGLQARPAQGGDSAPSAAPLFVPPLPSLETYTLNNAALPDGSPDESFLPGTLICDETDLACAAGDAEAKKAHEYAYDAYELYYDMHGRNSIDNAGMTIISTVHAGDDYGNAYWNGNQLVFGDYYSFTNADDVVAHEYTHGVTQYESGLFYYYQSGAINESFSDLWGEAVDQNNGAGNDSADVLWIIGEDATGLGGIRNMKSPTAFGDPDMMTSAYYYSGPSTNDNGGVHTNSGVNNKAVYLMVDGGTFNSQTVTALGWDKTLAIYYEAQANLLTSGSDYLDLYNALYQACLNLEGTNGITLADCQEVRDATNAVQMNLEPVVNFNPEAPMCAATDSPNAPIYYEDFEGGLGGWTTGGIDHPDLVPPTSVDNWFLNTEYAASGTSSLWANDYADGIPSRDPGEYSYNDSFAMMNTDVAIPSGDPVYLHFKHAYDLDDPNWDGVVLEYSTDGGTNWTDVADPASQVVYSAGQNYNDIIENQGVAGDGEPNPLEGREAFVWVSHGYVSSRYELSGLAGQSVRFRWRMGTDAVLGGFISLNTGGYYLDDVQVYACSNTPSAPALVSPANNALVTTYTPLLDWSDSTPAPDHYQIQLSTNNTFTAIVLDDISASSDYTPGADLGPNLTLYWRVRAVTGTGSASNWSAARSFRTLMAPPDLLSPADNALASSNRPTFDWTDIPSPITNYTIQVSLNPSFSPLAINKTATTSTYTSAVNLTAGATYYWRVKGNGTNGPSDWSTVLTVRIPNPPSVPSLTSPANNSLTTDYTPLLNWNNSTGPSGVTFKQYEVQLDDNSGFTSPDTYTTTLNDINDSQYQIASALTPNAKYYWRVRSVGVLSSEDHYSAWSTSRYFRTAVLPPVVNNVAVPVMHLRPTFTWNIVSGATSYTIQASKNSDFSAPSVNATVSGGSSVSYTPVVDLPADQTIYWRVKANAANGPSDWTNGNSFASPNPPSMPALVSPANNALTGDYTPTLDWNASTVPTGETFGYYHVQAAEDSGFSSLVMDDTSVTDVNTTQLDVSPALAPNDTYYWRVRAFNGAGEYSTWTASRVLKTSPLVPTLLTPADGITPSDLRPTFDWTDIAAANNYTIQIAKNAAFTSPTVNTTSAASTYTPTAALPANTMMYWRVRTNAASGASDWTPYRTFTTPNPPSVPTLSSPANNALLTSFTPVLDWNDSTVPAGAPSFKYYEVQVDNNSDFSSPEESGTTALNNITDSQFAVSPALAGNTKYYWRVRSVNQNDHTSLWSTSRYFRTIISAPVLSPVTADSLRPTFDWDDAVGSFTNYTIQVSKNDTFTQFVLNTKATNSTYTPTVSLPANTPLWWRVQINGANGPSAWTTGNPFTSPNPPSAPVLVSPANNYLTLDYTPYLNWNASTIPTGGAALDYYQVQVDNNSDFSSPEVDEMTTGTDTTNSEFTVPTDLATNTKFYWRVRAVNTIGEKSVWPASRYFRAAILPPVLNDVTGPLFNLRPTFTWTAVSGATNYTIQVSKNSTYASPTVNKTASGPTYTPVVDLPGGVPVYWRVRSNSANGPSDWVAGNSFTTPNPPSVPVLASPASNALTTDYTPLLNWNNSTVPSGVTFKNYELEVDNDSDFSSPVVDIVTALNDVTDSDYEPPLNLSSNTKYYWRVRSVNTLDEVSTWSAVRYFRTALLPPGLITPWGAVSTLRPTFDWIDTAGATSYTIQISREPDFSPLILNKTVTSSTYVPTTNLPANTLLYWRVKANGTNGPSAWSEVFTFTPQ
ncbi:MAG: M4 family metallopeptidase [Chloroflexota bacterium]